MRCGFCERIKKLRKVDVLMILCVCFFMYIANYFQMIEYREQKAQEKQKLEQKQEIDLKIYEELQRKCYFGQDKQACQSLKQF